MYKQAKGKKLLSMQTKHHFRSSETDRFQMFEECTNDWKKQFQYEKENYLHTSTVPHKEFWVQPTKPTAQLQPSNPTNLVLFILAKQMHHLAIKYN
jgi:hypothetical protein